MLPKSKQEYPEIQNHTSVRIEQSRKIFKTSVFMGFVVQVNMQNLRKHTIKLKKKISLALPTCTKESYYGSMTIYSHCLCKEIKFSFSNSIHLLRPKLHNFMLFKRFFFLTSIITIQKNKKAEKNLVVLKDGWPG